ncbi:hypothetical protein [Cellulomonas sp. P24]|uniref:hypothetical protein n=1 Tax=Cellulomonas sp. P24 TaxID=2885206 RepID=UPI00216AFBC6|nr:hypothetical protein [Cellulomonas sp. P24]MCR6491978.1 hypothetical protein [Cellulomonas sp. P24]
MGTPQTLSEADPRRIAASSADCAERVLGAFDAALRSLPPVGENASDPLGPGLLASGPGLTIIRELHARMAHAPSQRHPRAL